MQKQKPIGIFDSGVGGLSICREIRRNLPGEDLIYFADQAYSPYGEKTNELINVRAQAICQFFIEQNCKAIVVACNTATTNAINHLRSLFSIPIVGVEPAVKVAALTSVSKCVGILATEQTLLSQSFQLLKQRYENSVKIEVVACPEFIPLVETLSHQSQEAFDIVEQYVSPLITMGCDRIALGCTHFAFLEKALTHAAQNKALLIDTAKPVCDHLQTTLRDHNLLSPKSDMGTVSFYTSSEYYSKENPIYGLWNESLQLNHAVF